MHEKILNRVRMPQTREEYEHMLQIVREALPGSAYGRTDSVPRMTINITPSTPEPKPAPSDEDVKRMTFELCKFDGEPCWCERDTSKPPCLEYAARRAIELGAVPPPPPPPPRDPADALAEEFYGVLARAAGEDPATWPNDSWASHDAQAIAKHVLEHFVRKEG